MADFDSEFGGRKVGTHEFSKHLQELGGEQFFKELTDYQGRRSPSGPKPSWDYEGNMERTESEARYLAAMLDKLYGHWKSTGWTPMDPPPAGKTLVVGDPLLDEANRLAGKE